MERTEQQMIYKNIQGKPKDEQEAIVRGIPSEILIYELLHRMALCEGALNKFSPEFISDHLYKP